MTCGFASSELNNMLSSKDLILKLTGGSPKADIKIKQEDVRTTRTTFVGKVGKIFSKVESVLKIKVHPPARFGGVLKDLDMLPKRGLFKISSVNMISAYRSYLGECLKLNYQKILSIFLIYFYLIE
jgi:hypothetical protein